jgi:hypothetical protein
MKLKLKIFFVLLAALVFAAALGYLVGWSIAQREAQRELEETAGALFYTG